MVASTSRRSQYSSGQQQTGTNNRNDRNGNHQRQGQGQNQGQRQGQDPNMCRIHAHLGDRNHKWSDCIYNPRSQNYRPDLRPPDRRSNQSNQNQNQQQQQQAPAAGQYMTQFPHFNLRAKLPNNLISANFKCLILKPRVRHRAFKCLTAAHHQLSRS